MQKSFGARALRFWSVLVSGCVLGGTATAQIVRPEVSFVENRGQWPDSVLFVGRSNGIDVRIERDALWFSTVSGQRGGKSEDRGGNTGEDGNAAPLVTHSIRLRLRGGEARAVVGSGAQPGPWHFYGANGMEPVTHVSSFASVRMVDVLPGVDWVITSDSEGRPQYDFELEPGVKPSQLELIVEGVESLALEGGAVRAHQEGGSWEMSAPVASQPDPAGESVREAAWVRAADGSLRFVVDAVDESIGLTIDPSVSFSSYLGGTKSDFVVDLHMQDDGILTLVGETRSVNFPVTPGAYGGPANGVAPDVFVTRLGEGGTTPVFSAIFSSDFDAYFETNPKVDVWDGRVAVCFSQIGFTPSTGAYSSGPSGLSVDIAIAQMSTDGSALEYLATIGGSGPDTAAGMLALNTGSVVVYGPSNVADMPAENVFHPPTTGLGIHSGGFVVELASDGSDLTRSLVLGGSNSDSLVTLDILECGDLLVGGLTSSNDFPVTPDAFQDAVVPTQLNGDVNGFVARLSPSWDEIKYATYISSSRYGSTSGVHGVGGTGYWAVTRADEQDIPFPPSVDVAELELGVGPIIVTLFDAATNEVVKARWAFSQLIAGSVIDADGGLILLGSVTPNAKFPQLSPGEPWGPPGRATVSKLDPLGDSWVWSYAFGGSLTDPGELVTEIYGEHLFAPERIVLGGVTEVVDMLVSSGAVDPNHGPANQWEGWFGEFDMRPTGFERFGEPTEACNGPIRIGLRRLATAGEAGFGLSCIGAPRNAPGVLARSPGFLAVPIDVGGIALHLDLAGLFLSPVVADSLGRAGAQLPLSNVPAGVKAYFQFAWVDPGSCGSLGGLSASDAIGVEVQP